MPANALSGRVYVRARGGVRSNIVGPVKVMPAQKDNAPSSPKGTPFDGAGMWMWELPTVEGGDPSAIAQRALGNNVSTVFIKSGDGTNYWDQFSPQLVAAAEGARAARVRVAVRLRQDPRARPTSPARGQGSRRRVLRDRRRDRSTRASTTRRASTPTSCARPSGADYPIGLAGFPYVDYHPSYPFSAFLGGRRAVQPAAGLLEGDRRQRRQGRRAHLHVNRPYGRPIVPIGQTYNPPPVEEIQRFRQLVAANGSTGHSWWSWQETQDARVDRDRPAARAARAARRRRGAFVTVKRGNSGDLVLWAQGHLSAAGFATRSTATSARRPQEAVTRSRARAACRPTARSTRRRGRSCSSR